jgi:hypothetical protein
MSMSTPLFFFQFGRRAADSPVSKQVVHEDASAARRVCCMQAMQMRYSSDLPRK